MGDCYIAALKQSETVAVQAQQIEIEEERLRQAKGAILPSLNGFASYLVQENPGGFGGSIFPSTQPLVRINATQPLFRGFREFAALRAEKELVGAQNEAWRSASLQLYRDVAQAFYSVVSLENDLGNLRTEISLYEKRIQELISRREIGRSRNSEVLAVQSIAATLRAQSDVLKGQIANARDILQYLTGLEATVALNDQEPVPPKPAPLESYLSDLEKRPDIRAEIRRTAAAEESIRVASGAHLPSVDLIGNYFIVRRGALKEVDWDVQLGLTLPIWAGGVISSRVREAEAQSRVASLGLSRARRLAEQEIRVLHDTFEADLRQRDSLREATEIAERNFNDQNREYRLGLVTNIDVLQALTSFQENRRALDRVGYALKLDIARLEAAVARRPIVSDPGTPSGEGPRK